MMRRFNKLVFGFATMLALLVGCQRADIPPPAPQSPPLVSHVTLDASGVFHVWPDSLYPIQAALDAAAENATHKTVRVHTGTYRPQHAGFALIHLLARHDGIRLEAEGAVVLTAANQQVSDANLPSHPAIVNHVVFFGDGISEKTVLSGFEITGASGFVVPPDAVTLDQESTHPVLEEKGAFYYLDGGAIKIFGRSYPQLLDLKVHDNTTRLCGGGVSIEHRDLGTGAVVIRNCVFVDNRCPATGSAVDVLEGSSAIIENCLFVGNIANYGMDTVKQEFGLIYNEEHGSGALTVFPRSQVEVRRCTFTKNWNAVDDRGRGNVYEHCIFAHNDASDGSRKGRPYEIDILDARRVKNCFLSGKQGDLRGTIDSSSNRLDAVQPNFDDSFQPLATEFVDVGYRTPDKPTRQE